RGIIRNTISYYNTALIGEANTRVPEEIIYSCTTPAVAGAGNITTPPQFVNLGGNDFRLRNTSPCIDAGVFLSHLGPGFDRDGRQRVFHLIDIGAYEFTIHGSLRAFLQGPWDTNALQMSASLPLPIRSPYESDIRTAPSIPSNAVDWVLIELRAESNAPPAWSRSVFIGQDGFLMDDTGQPLVALEVTPGDYYVVLKHHNHLTIMSSNRLPVNAEMVTGDLTSELALSGGGTGAIELSPGQWGMIAGDADGDGLIHPLDRLIHETTSGVVGYRRADFNLDGVVDPADRTMYWMANQGRVSAAPAPEVIRHPSLDILPPRATLINGTTNLLVAFNGTTSVHWAFASNRSGAFVLTNAMTSVLYQAGAAHSTVDVIQAWNPDDLLGRTYLNVISAADATALGKAVIIAGGRDLDDPVWDASRYIADKAYNTLRYRGYARENIQYLCLDPDRDVDGNGLEDDSALPTTFNHCENAITQWVGNANELFVFLVDHGADLAGAGSFRLNAGELLPAVT
ncbi:MAG: choice-of-anchor Q domain-containing protein, partial [Verrucomicrobiota bacterium]